MSERENPHLGPHLRALERTAAGEDPLLVAVDLADDLIDEGRDEDALRVVERVNEALMRRALSLIDEARARR